MTENINSEKTRKTDLSQEEKSRLTDDILEYGWINIRLIAQWCGNLSGIADELVKSTEVGANWREGLFWIRLWAVVVELHERYSELKASGEGNAFATDIADTIERIRSKFTEDELTLLDYQRHTNCHILQEGYRLAVRETKNGPKLRETYNIKTIPKILPIEELNAIVSRMTKKYNADHSAMARDFASRTQADLEHLWQSMNKRAQEHSSRGYGSSLRTRSNGEDEL